MNPKSRLWLGFLGFSMGILAMFMLVQNNGETTPHATFDEHRVIKSEPSTNRSLTQNQPTPETRDEVTPLARYPNVPENMKRELFIWNGTYFKDNPHCRLDSSQSLIDERKAQVRERAKLQYRSPAGNEGKLFNISHELLDRLGLEPKLFIKLTHENVDDFVFVTGGSSNHFREGLHGVGGVQQLFPQKTIVYYDLGLTSAQVEQVKKQCNVKYKKFNFDRYPKHIRNLHNYGWKQLLMLETLHEYPGAMWYDTSIRFNSSDISMALDLAVAVGGVTYFSIGWHSVYSTTHPGMYEYMATDAHAMKLHSTRVGGFFLWYRTEAAFWRVQWPIILCVLDKDCIAPPGSRLSCGSADALRKRWDIYANCHRYDAALCTLLLLTEFNFDMRCHVVPNFFYNIARSLSGPTAKSC